LIEKPAKGKSKSNRNGKVNVRWDGCAGAIRSVNEESILKPICRFVFAAISISILVGCSRQPSTTNADSTSNSSSVWDNLTSKTKPEPRLVVPAGTRLRVALTDAISSDKSRPGDSFMASLAEPVVIDGKTALEKGTKVRGMVIDAKGSGRVKGRASIQLTLTEIMPAGKSLKISTKSYSAVAESTKTRDAAVVGGGAGVGAAIGALAGGGKGALIGAAVGGGAGTGTVLATKGKEIHYSPETRIPFTLAHSIEI
jgi:hypothetical protein